ncbi:U-box domain-containing protein 35-like [Vigna unguiculata]|uniref:U-box domain-containing protein 35-like n=1 Tax=Vigna unguiculata TaxID=3917 RepID=UPI001016DC8C|nr:U-box domain-containing protein 35-like [Vigna unguiculata]
MFSNTPTTVVVGRDSTVIAVSGGRHSNGAVKWAVEHLLKKNSSCILLHVRTKTMLTPENNNDAPKNGRPPNEEELHQFFLPFRGFCARKGISTKELVLHDLDVTSALIAFVVDNCISTLVVGAATSSWGSILRRFNKDDVSASLAKSLPDTCSLYVISKGKVQHIRPSGPIKDIVNFLESDPLDQPHKDLTNNQIAFEDIERKLIKDVVKHQSNKLWEYLHEETNSPKSPIEYPSSQNSSANNTPGNSDSTGQTLGPPLINKLHENQKVVVSFDMQMRKLKLELQKTAEMYGMACKEAVLATQKAMEIEKYRQEKERDMEEAKLAQTKMTMESTQMSKHLVKTESQKRREVELKSKHEEGDTIKALQEVIYNNIPYRKYTIEDIDAATNKFDNALKIGEGGYGPVFKGVLDHTTVAIKAVKPDLAYAEKQFQQEVIVLSTIRHPNMVLLLGACPEFGVLVYEYMVNGSLEDRLLQRDNSPPIPWKTRFKIASEIATGLLFLHQTKPEPLVHRDLKPANILLDKNYVSKISDVGLARLVPPSMANQTTQYRLTGAAGTFCYIDPEYQQTGLLGVKSDVYSLGVVLLQIITAKSPMGLSHLVEKALMSNTLSEVLDPSVKDWPIEETSSFAKLALKCCELRKRDRPDLGTVVLPELNKISRLWDDENIYPLRHHMA